MCYKTASGSIHKVIKSIDRQIGSTTIVICIVTPSTTIDLQLRSILALCEGGPLADTLITLKIILK